ncbi:MAG TPA: hypothetical protein VFQ83_08980 [Candidatus Udaeobacter sp.]|jgi:hypothetical protein|nr:hypothetical protein [Candidatus Udaeobacter sp.]
MNLAIPIRDHRLIGYEDYEPVSDVGEKLTRRWAQEKNYLKGSASDWLPTVDASFRTIRDECQNAGWDGPGSLAISDQVIAITEKVVRALFTLVPKGIPAPDVIPEADGEICLHWVADTEQELSISIGAHGKINFAGQFGKEGAIHGWQSVDTTSATALDRSLQEIAKYLARLFPPTVSSRRA